jgi:hypothetical protein
MLRFVPWIEVRVMEEGGGLLGRCFVDPRECLSTEQDPAWRELFRGNPEQDEGGVFLSIQLLHKNDPLLAVMPVELCPVRTTGAEDFMSDRTRVGRIANENSKPIFMRDCRIQVAAPSHSAVENQGDQTRADRHLASLSVACRPFFS